MLRRKMQKQTQMRRSLHIGKTHDQHLEARYLEACFTARRNGGSK